MATIDEIKEQKIILEDKIARMIDAFERDYKVQVKCINIIGDSECKIIYINAEI